MKKLLAAALAAVFLGSLCACTVSTTESRQESSSVSSVASSSSAVVSSELVSNDPVDTETAEVEFSGITLDVPADWEVEEPAEGSLLYLYPDRSVSLMGTLISQESISTYTPGNEDSLRDMAEIFLASDSIQNAIPIGDELVEIGGAESLRQEYTAQVSGGNIRGVTYFFIFDQGQAVFTMWTGADLDSDLIDSTLHEFDSCAKSMDFTNFSVPTVEETSSEESSAPSSDAVAEPSSPAVTGSSSQQEALSTAERYLSVMAFSHEGLVGQLEFEGFTTEDATWAADNCGADWNEQAVKKAENYIDTMPFSYTGLIDQLEYEGFTTEQATHGVDSITVDWNEQAAKKAQSYLDLMDFSRQELIDQLLYEGFTSEQASYGVTQVGM